MVCFAALTLGVCRVDAADAPVVRAAIQPVQDRRPAQDFLLQDAAGKNVRLSDYRGKVVLLDFWATACGGCVREMPWFMDVARAYEKKGVAVLGVSVDILYESLKDSDEAWGRVKPFIQTHKVNYRILMGDDQVTGRYNITALPLTYLIDTRGRIAATYRGVVDKANVEANIQTVLKESKRLGF
jgi:peroxiredoxin